MLRISRRRFVVAATGPAVVALIAGGFLLAQGAKADNTIAVEVDAGSSLGTVPASALGVNTGVFDGDLNDSAASTALQNAGVDALRYPGGSTSDAYDWQSNTTVSGQGYANPSNDFDDFMGIANKVGASPVITVNYGSGTPAEAAAWVTYADVTKNYGIKYWELGNEVYGDGTYGADWEYNTKAKGATAYADNIEDYITQMKAADSSIKVGAVLTAYGDWPDGLVAGDYGDTADWNETVLKTDGADINFVILHSYPSSNGEAGMLAQYQNLANMVKQTRAEINEYAGSNAPNIQIMVTETNSGYEYDAPATALYAADTYMSFLENGVSNVDWWDLHNGASTISTDPDGKTDYGDGAILSSGNCTGSTCEPATDTPFPAYSGIKAVGDFAPAGAEMLTTTSSDDTVTSYAVQRSDGGVNLLLVNHSSDTSEPVSLGYNDFTAGEVTSGEQFTQASPTLTSLTGVSANGLTLPPYSITVLKLSSGGTSTAVGSGGTGEVHAVGASKCLDVSGFTTTPGTQTQIWNCNGGTNQTWTHTPSNELTVYSGTSTMCLDANSNQTTPGTKVQIWPCNGGQNQQWDLNSNGTITGVQSGLCLDVAAASTAEGALAQLWSCNGGSNQQWTLG